MSYIAILGKHPQLSLRELELLTPSNLVTDQHIAVFETSVPERLTDLAWIIKWGELLDEHMLEEKLGGTTLFGIADKTIGMSLKKKYGLKRFKQVDLDETDKEIRDGWVEMVHIPLNISKKLGKETDVYALITGYQNIERFELIDIQKPVRGMEVGMMPAKLTQILVNIGVGVATSQWISAQTIYDPFCGFGTTWFVANSLWYKFIGSDIVITSAKQNLPWRKWTTYYSELPFTLFKHDVKEAFDKHFLKEVNVIVTEWWLGPVIHHQMTPVELQRNLAKVEELYTVFVKHVAQFFEHLVVVMTMPEYQKKNATGLHVHQKITAYAETQWFETEILPELYMRKGQLVARRVVILRK